MEKTLLALLSIVLSLALAVPASATGLLPSLSTTVGIAMPSLGEALHRYPDSETEKEDGCVVETYRDINDSDFNTFSVYLEQKGAILSDYRVNGNVMTASIEVNGGIFEIQYDTGDSTVLVIYPRGTYDDRLKSAKSHYHAACELTATWDLGEAMAELHEIPDYDTYLPVVTLLQKMKQARFTKIGGIVTFGHYEQDNDKANGPEPIEWVVLDYDQPNNRVLLLSRYGLDSISYHNNKWKIVGTWANCSLRAWLNGSFINNAFSVEEQTAILTTTLDNSKTYDLVYNKRSISAEESSTKDQVFLLDFEEAEKYLNVTNSFNKNSNETSIVNATEYAFSKLAEKVYSIYRSPTDRTAEWWLRSHDGAYAHIVHEKGTLSTASEAEDAICVRPAFWLNLDSDIIKQI